MSRHTDTVNAWLNELAVLAGIDGLALNPEGVCALRYGDRAEIVFELPEDSDVLHLYCPVAPVPEADQAAFYRRLLEWNMFGLETRGASFAVDRGSERAMLCYALPIEGTDVLAFQNTVGNFAEVSERFCDELHGASTPAAGTAAMQGLRV
ncbi:CesT family type III secretion system chaperone [Pseudothauera rhizosphaerae]|uniref:Tir chaperone protein (CesT) n=1 Tax=Pseudothauera rhizosphaerae TaxID=2565932 RepID=A0A4S4AFV7_9RHOO|nr:CesT family type III secretion system chaperone [Pseudothauera rhizosphaerae]THF58094.1 hypothetical protein E6O51_17285 [Pseudothauera rhizosphaerae]